MSFKDPSSTDALHDYWMETVLEDRAESAPPPTEPEESR
jgi:hypothetical protein